MHKLVPYCHALALKKTSSALTFYLFFIFVLFFFYFIFIFFFEGLYFWGTLTWTLNCVVRTNSWKQAFLFNNNNNLFRDYIATILKFNIYRLNTMKKNFCSGFMDLTFSSESTFQSTSGYSITKQKAVSIHGFSSPKQQIHVAPFVEILLLEILFWVNEVNFSKRQAIMSNIFLYSYNKMKFRFCVDYHNIRQIISILMLSY